ncbi:hypothetical protein DL239_20995 [Sedimentitalea sp. CY04]|uniref:Lipoprotein n=2 Tax=Parasedimentitalea denitrificans TaxID=2211118 RepID=A0ABX0WCK5_9RHOB|nr:hypothetical protein [Sedimentitalea sp. CY04]
MTLPFGALLGGYRIKGADMGNQQGQGKTASKAKKILFPALLMVAVLASGACWADTSNDDLQLKEHWAFHYYVNFQDVVEGRFPVGTPAAELTDWLSESGFRLPYEIRRAHVEMFTGDFSSLSTQQRQEIWFGSAKNIGSLCGVTTHVVYWERDKTEMISTIRTREQRCYFEIP